MNDFNSIEKHFITMKYTRLILMGMICLWLGACASETDPAQLYKDQTAEQIFRDGENAMLKGQYDKAIKHFEALDARYPFGEHTQQGQLDMIYTYYQQNDYPSALAAADQYIRLYPRGPHTDYAYYMRGIIEFEENHGVIERHLHIDFSKRDLTGLHSAYLDFNQLLQFFPDSSYAPDARQRMIYIRNIFAQHQLQVAEFYFARKAYVAAINRATEVVQHYQETPVVPDALALMVKGYRALNFNQEAQDTLKTLKLNYPDSDAYEDVGED